jgi:hypothetical protein
VKRGATFTTLDLFETAKVVEALSVQIDRIDAALKCGAFAKAKRIEARCQVNGLTALRDRLNKRCVPAIESLRREAQAPAQEEQPDAR